MYAASKGEENKKENCKIRRIHTLIMFACTAIHLYIHIFHNLFFFKNTRLYTFCFLSVGVSHKTLKAHVYEGPLLSLRVPFYSNQNRVPPVYRGMTSTKTPGRIRQEMRAPGFLVYSGFKGVRLDIFVAKSI